MASDLITYEGFNLFCNNVDKALSLKTLKVGGYKEKTEDFRPGFADMSINLGMGAEAFVFEFHLMGEDPETLSLFGYGAGTVQNFTAYKASKSRFSTDRGVKQTIIHVRGRIMEAEEDELEGGKLTGTKYKVGEIQAIKHVREGVLLQHYDITGGGNLLTRSDVMRALGR